MPKHTVDGLCGDVRRTYILILFFNMFDPGAYASVERAYTIAKRKKLRPHRGDVGKVIDDAIDIGLESLDPVPAKFSDGAGI